MKAIGVARAGAGVKGVVVVVRLLVGERIVRRVVVAEEGVGVRAVGVRVVPAFRGVVAVPDGGLAP